MGDDEADYRIVSSLDEVKDLDLVGPMKPVSVSVVWDSHVNWSNGKTREDVIGSAEQFAKGRVKAIYRGGADFVLVRNGPESNWGKRQWYTSSCGEGESQTYTLVCDVYLIRDDGKTG